MNFEYPSPTSKDVFFNKLMIISNYKKVKIPKGLDEIKRRLTLILPVEFLFLGKK